MAYLRSDSDAPTIDMSVLARLRSVNPDLFVIWKRYRIDYQTGRYLIVEKGPERGNPVPWPYGGGRWLVCIRNLHGSHVLFPVFDPEDGESYAPIDHRVVDRLLMDAAKFMSPEEIAATLESQQEVRTEKLRNHLKLLQEENFQRNKKKILEVLDGDNIRRLDVPRREPKIFGYGGQVSRITRGETIERSAEEDGWDLVDIKKEMEKARG